jgi:hypothetical protein
MVVFLFYLIANVLLAVGAFYIATSRPEYSRLLWWITGAFVACAIALVIDVITNPSLSRLLLHP